MLLAVIVLTFATFTVLTWLVMAPSDEQRLLWERIGQVRHVGADPRTAEEDELSRPFAERVVLPMVEVVSGRLLRLTPQAQRARLEQRLIQAGRPLEIGQFLTIKGIALGLGFLLGVAAFLWQGEAKIGRGLVLIAALPGLSWTLPDFWLSRRVQERRRRLQKALPDALDLLSVSVEAGLGFDGAMQKVAEKFPEPISSEFQAYLKEIRLGHSRAEALRNLADRSDLPDLRTFVAAVLQADQLGSSISRVLRIQADSLREKRRQRAEEQAMKAPVKMLLPLVLFIFPTIFIVVLGPAAIRLMGGIR